MPSTFYLLPTAVAAAAVAANGPFRGRGDKASVCVVFFAFLPLASSMIANSGCANYCNGPGVSGNTQTRTHTHRFLCLPTHNSQCLCVFYMPYGLFRLPASASGRCCAVYSLVHDYICSSSRRWSHHLQCTSFTLNGCKWRRCVCVCVLAECLRVLCISIEHVNVQLITAAVPLIGASCSFALSLWCCCR